MSITEKVRKYLEVSGAVEIAGQSVADALCRLEKGPASIIEKARKVLEEKLGKAAILDVMTMVYEEYYSEEELDAAIAFYESPIGRSIASKAVEIMKKTSPMIASKANQAIHEIAKTIFEDFKDLPGSEDDEPNPWRTS